MALRRKTRSPHTTGDDDPRPGISTFHLTLCFSLHVVGGLAVFDTPVMYGPRHWAQYFSLSSAPRWATATPRNTVRSRSDRRMADHTVEVRRTLTTAALAPYDSFYPD